MPPGLADDTPRICEHTEGLKRLRCPRKDGPAGGQGAADEGLRRGCLRDLRDSCQRARRDPNLPSIRTRRREERRGCGCPALRGLTPFPVRSKRVPSGHSQRLIPR